MAVGLTEDHPSLTTYFEGEIIGSKYTFITQHPEWGSNEKVDRQHWARFPAYKPLSKHSSRPDLVMKDWMQKEHLFMRWKEYFLVPDHRVRTISGASFEGFYYISFNQVSGGIEGIYFHAKSEKYVWSLCPLVPALTILPDSRNCNWNTCRIMGVRAPLSFDDYD